MEAALTQVKEEVPLPVIVHRGKMAAGDIHTFIVIKVAAVTRTYT